jgi:hypothetical protein
MHRERLQLPKLRYAQRWALQAAILICGVQAEAERFPSAYAPPSVGNNMVAYDGDIYQMAKHK